MAKNFRGVGKSIQIDGQTADRDSGTLFRRQGTGAGNLDRGWIGVVTDDIIGTSSTQQDVSGRPVILGDGAAAEAQTGEGKGDMEIVGIFTHPLPTSGMVVNDTDPVYMRVSDVTNPGVTASGVTNNESANFTRFAISGALVGFAVGANYTATVPPFNGMNVVDYKLLGLPLHVLSTDGPATATSETVS